MHDGGGLSLDVICQASRDIGDPVSGQHLGLIGLVSTFALPDLLGTAFFRSFAILGSDRIRVRPAFERRPAHKKPMLPKEPGAKLISRQTSLACG